MSLLINDMDNSISMWDVDFRVPTTVIKLFKDYKLLLFKYTKYTFMYDVVIETSLFQYDDGDCTESPYI